MQPASASAQSVLGASILALAALFPALSLAQSSGANFPKLVKIVVPFEPGASTDIFARLVAQKLGARTGSAFVVENRSGATGSIGAERFRGMRFCCIEVDGNSAELTSSK